MNERACAIYDRHCAVLDAVAPRHNTVLVRYALLLAIAEAADLSPSYIDYADSLELWLAAHRPDVYRHLSPEYTAADAVLDYVAKLEEEVRGLHAQIAQLDVDNAQLIALRNSNNFEVST